MSGRIYGGTGITGHLFVYDPATGESTDLGKAVGEGDYAVRALTVGRDGKIHGGTYHRQGDAQFFVYDPVTLQLLDKLTAVAGEYNIPSLLTGPDGMIYGGTGWQGHLFVYNPDDASLSDKGSSMEGWSINALTTGPEGLIYGGTSGGYLFSYDPTNDAIEDLGQAPADPSSTNCLVTGQDGWIYGGTSERRDGRFFSYEPSTRTFTDLGLAHWKDEYVTSLLVYNDGAIYGATGHPAVLFSYNPADHPYNPSGSCTSMDIAPAIVDLGEPTGDGILALAEDSDGRIFIGCSDGHLWAYSPSDGQVEDLGQAVGGEAWVFPLSTGGDGRIYGGTSPNAHLFVYEPPTDLFTDLGQPVPGETRVWGLTTGSDGRIYGGTYPSAHLFVYDPATGLSHDLGQPVTGESHIMSLTTGLDGRIYGGTATTHGHLFVYDPDSGLFTDLGQAVAGEPEVESLATAPDGTIWGYTCCGGHLFQHNPATGAFSDKGRAAPGEVIALTVAADGTVYGGTSQGGRGELFRYDPTGDHFTRLGQVLRGETWIWSLLFHDNGLLYGGTGNDHLFTYDPNLVLAWDVLTYKSTVPEHTALTVDVLDIEDHVLMSDVPSGGPVSLDASTYPALRLRANLSTADGNLTPRLDQWTLRWLVTPVNQPPANGTVTPSSGSGSTGVTTTFTTTWTDANGWEDLKHCYFHIGASPSIVGNVTLLYNAAKDKLWLRSDDGAAWTGGCAPGTVEMMENGQAMVQCGETTVEGAGHTLSVRWAITFKDVYTGSKKLGLKCKDRQKAKAKGAWKGTWTIE